VYQLLCGVILVCIVELQSPSVIAYGVLVASRTLANQTCIGQSLDVIAVECNVSSQRHGQALRKLSLLLDVAQEGRHVSCFPLGGGVQGNAHQLVIYERVVETILNCCCELLQIILVQRKGRDNLIVQHLVHEALDRLIMHAVTNDVLACQISTQNESGVCAV